MDGKVEYRTYFPMGFFKIPPKTAYIQLDFRKYIQKWPNDIVFYYNM